MSQEISIARASPEEAAAFVDIRRRAVLHACQAFYTMAEIDAWTASRASAAIPGPVPAHFYVAKSGDVVVGTGMLDANSGRINAMFVLPEHMGRGIGKAMMRHLESVARSLGLRELVLDATLNAADFYRSLGFQSGTPGSFCSSRGFSLSCVPMTKRLA